MALRLVVSFSHPRIHIPVLSGGDAFEFAENAVEAGDALEAGAHGDLGEAKACVREEGNGMVDADHVQPLAVFHAGQGLEGSGKMLLGDSRALCHGGLRQILRGQVALDEIGHTDQLLDGLSRHCAGRAPLPVADQLIAVVVEQDQELEQQDTTPALTISAFGII